MDTSCIIKNAFDNPAFDNTIPQLFPFVKMNMQLFIKYYCGDFESALKHYNKSIEIKPDNYFAYINRANYYFRINEYDNAVANAKKALEIKNNGVEAASLLTVIYALTNDDENKKKYYHIAITSGRHPALTVFSDRCYKIFIEFSIQSSYFLCYNYRTE